MATPMYCSLCKRNVVPTGREGGTGLGLQGAHLLFTIITCGLWFPFWFFLVAAKGRGKKGGGCPICGNPTLLPPRTEE